MILVCPNKGIIAIPLRNPYSAEIKLHIYMGICCREAGSFPLRDLRAISTPKKNSFIEISIVISKSHKNKQRIKQKMCFGFLLLSATGTPKNDGRQTLDIRQCAQLCSTVQPELKFM